MFEKIARFSVKFRWLILVAWIVAVPLFTAVFPNINDVTKNNNSDFLPKNSRSAEAERLYRNFTKKDISNQAFVVAGRDNGPLTEADLAALKQIMAKIAKQPDVTNVTDLGPSADGQAHQYKIDISSAGFGNKAIDIAKNIRAQLTGAPNGLNVHMAGEFAEAVDSADKSSKGRNNTELFTVIFILLLLLFVFRSVLAPLVTLFPAGLALAISQPVIAESTKIGVQVSFLTQILLIVLVLGAGTDYGLFLVFRVREELRKGLEPQEAVVAALARVGESITFSALTVVAALMCLLFSVFGLYKGLGPSLSIALGIMLLISLTFLPALLSIMGRVVFWPSKTRKTTLKIGAWGRVADAVIKRPVTMLLVGIVIFAGLSLGIKGYQTAGFASDGPPAKSDSAYGKAIIEKHYPAANINPQIVLFEFNQPVWNNPQKLADIQQSLEQSSAFKAVSGPLNANGFKLNPAELKTLHDSGQLGQLQKVIDQFISKDGKTVQYLTIGNYGKPTSVEAINATPKLYKAVDNAGKKVGAQQQAIFGNDAVAYDVTRTTNSDLKRIIPIVLIIIGILLAILLRSLVAPWYLIITVGLSFLATLGFAMIVFVHLGGQDGLNFVLPFMMFIFSMALGEDYNILVMSRIREESHHEKHSADAVTKAVGITGTTVTSAGLILAGTFAVFGLVGGDEQIHQIGYSIAFGILLDTFFVRTLLVPSIVALLGRNNWWPSRLYYDFKK